jgi:rubredoxin
MPRSSRVKVTGQLADSLKNDLAPGIVLPLVKGMLIAKHGPDTERDWTVIHPSEMAKPDWCTRATWLRITSQIDPPQDKFDFIRTNIFGEGNMIHAKWQKWLAETGKLWGSWECALCHWVYDGTPEHPPTRDQIEPDGGWAPGTDWYCPLGYGEPLAHMWEYKEVHMQHGLVYGHSDGALLDDRALVEIKSVGLGTLRIEAPEFLQRYQKDGKTDLTGLWKGLERPLKSHVRQGDVYLWLAQQLGLPFDKIVYLYEFKANQMVKEFTVTYNEERVQQLVDKAKAIEYAVKSGTECPCSIDPVRGCSACQVPTKKKVRRVVR